MRMRTTFFAVLLVLPLTLPASETAKPAIKPAGVVIEKVENEGTIKRLFDEMWAKLRSYGPKLTTSDGRTGASVIAGVRGNESTGTQLKPYWKGDRTNDPAYLQEVNAYNEAQALAESGDAAKAAVGFEEFLKNYPNSAFKPNAQFALGLAYGAGGEKVKGRTVLDIFVRDYPAHPLVADAKRVNEALR